MGGSISAERRGKNRSRTLRCSSCQRDVSVRQLRFCSRYAAASAAELTPADARGRPASLPLDGKEGVDGSSPSEGLRKGSANAGLFCLARSNASSSTALVNLWSTSG